MSISAVPEDYAQKKRPSGAAYDVGAYENGSTTSTSTSTATSSTGPSIQMSSPSTDGASVSGSVSIASTASDSDGIANMKVYVDGVLKKSSTTNAISYSWSTSGQRIGTHQIMVSATDSRNNSTRFYRSVSVTSSTASTSTSTTTASSGSTTSSSPVVSVSSPSADGALVRGTVSIVASATGIIKRMAVYVDGVLKHSTTGNSISYSWNSSGLRIGSHQILISATDHENKWARLIRTVKVY
jgi:hypothetical protein